MTTNTKTLTMLAGGIVSLALAGACSAGHNMKVCEVCDHGDANANVWVQHHGDDSKERKISIKINTDDGPVVFESDDLDFDFDFDMDFDFEWDSDDASEIHDVLIKKLGGMHGEHDAHGKHIIELHKEHLAKAPKALHTKKLHLKELKELKKLKELKGLKELHGLRELIELHGHDGGQHDVIIERLHGHDDGFSMGDLGLDGAHADGHVEVIIKTDGDDHQGANKFFIKKGGHGQSGNSFIIKSDGENVWTSEGGQSFDLAEIEGAGGNVIFLRGDGSDADVKMKIEKELAKVKSKAKAKAKKAKSKAKSKSKAKGLHTSATFDVQIGDGQGENIFAWASEDEKPAAPQGKPRMMIGVTLGSISEALASQLGVDASGVVMIESVSDGMPAEKSGLRRFDIITKVDGKSPVNTPMLQKIIGSKGEGDQVKVEILRGGDAKTFKIGLASAPSFPEGLARVELAERDRVRAQERELRTHERAQARTEQNLARAQERLQRSRELAEVRRFKGGEDLQAIIDQLETLDLELDEKTMAQLHEHLAELGEHMHGMDFTFEMPNIEFVPGEGDGEDIVVIEGAPDARFFKRDGNNIQFAPKAKGKSFTFPGGQGGNVFFERNSETSDRLDALEERMERIERMLEKIAERID